MLALHVNVGNVAVNVLVPVETKVTLLYVDDAGSL